MKMPELEISTQEVLELLGVVYDGASDASCLLYDLIEKNPMLADVKEIKQLQHILNKVIWKIESDTP
jgi:hypothetical protein